MGAGSEKNIETQDRLIVALDFPDNQTAMSMVSALGNEVTFYKAGLELFMGGEYFHLIQWLKDQGKRVFVDLKFFDVPETVRRAVRQLQSYGVDFATVHGNDGMLKAAAEEKGDTRILAVTALTSLDAGDLEDLGFQCSVEQLVLSRARRALEAGCDGVVSSGIEATALRKYLDHRLMVVCPGIRPVTNDHTDDQKRTVDVAQAFANGADHIVVGRPITRHPDGLSPVDAARLVQQQIAACFRS